MSMSESSEEKMEWKDDIVALILDSRGEILECNLAAEKLFGYSAGELISRHVSVLLPQLEEGLLVRNDEINPRLKFMCHCGQLFLVIDRQCRTFFSELHLVALSGPTVRAIFCPAMS